MNKNITIGDYGKRRSTTMRSIKDFTLLFFLTLALTGSIVAETLPPQISVESDKVDFGSYEAKLKKEAVYTITNKGGSLLKIINIRKNCGCAEARADNVNLNPGESTKFKVIVLGDSIYGEYSKNAYVETNDPKQKLTTLTFTGNAIPILKIIPKSMVYAGVLQKGAEFNEKFQLEAENDKIVFGEPVVDCAYPVKVNMKKETSKSYSLEVSIRPETPGILKCKVNIPVKSPEGWKAPEILIIGDVGKKIMAIPSTLILPGISTQTVEKQVSIKLLGDNPTADLMRKIRWVAPKGIGIGPAIEKDSLWQFNLSISPEFLQSLSKGETQTITVNLSDFQPAKITISLADG
jgi:hypothetical protein